MKELLIVAALAVLSSAASAGNFSYYCDTEVSCNQLFNDLVTDKFIKKYPDGKWEIFVLTSMAHFSDGSASGTAIIGVRPLRKDDLNVLPTRKFYRNGYRENLENTYAFKEFEKNLIRNAITDMMAKCDDTPSCDISR